MREIIVFIIFFAVAAKAHHPNEGLLKLEDLIHEAMENNPSLKEASSHLTVVKKESQVLFSLFAPEVSLEGGPFSAKVDDEKSSGTALYGKAEWNLYHGGRDRSLMTKAGLNSKWAERQISLSTATVQREVARVYYEMLFALESIALKERAIEMNQEQMKLARVKKHSGFTSMADVIEFELREATLVSDLKRLVQEKEDRSRELSVLVGRKEPVSTLLVKGHLQREPSGLNKTEILHRLDENNPEILEAMVNRDLAAQDKDIVRADFMPQVDFEGRYGKLPTEDRISTENDNYSLFLKVKVPLFSGLSTIRQISAESAKVERSEMALTRTRLAARAEVENLLAQIGSTLARLDLEEKTLARSEEYYKITLDEYRRGVKNSPDMVTAAERLLEARIRNLEYRRDYYLTKLRVFAVVGAY